MNITSLSGGNKLMLTETGNMNAIDTSLLRKSLDMMEINGDMITKMMEQSVNPNIGANIDVRL